MSSDFDKFLYELDITEKQLINWMNDQDINNLTEIESDYYFKKKSKVHGIGVFSNKDFCKFDYIGIVSLNNKRATLARWINHSRNGNVHFLPYNNKNYPNVKRICIAKRDIKKNTELKINYRYVNQII